MYKDVIEKILDFDKNADYKRLSCDEIAILKKYITKLQKENKKYIKLGFEHLCKKNTELERKINQAMFIYETRNTNECKKLRFF